MPERLTEIRERVLEERNRCLDLNCGLTPQEASAYAAGRSFYKLMAQAAKEGTPNARGFYMDRYFRITRLNIFWSALEKMGCRF